MKTERHEWTGEQRDYLVTSFREVTGPLLTAALGIAKDFNELFAKDFPKPLTAEQLLSNYYRFVQAEQKKNKKKDGGMHQQAIIENGFELDDVKIIAFFPLSTGSHKRHMCKTQGAFEELCEEFVNSSQGPVGKVHYFPRQEIELEVEKVVHVKLKSGVG